MKHFIQTKSKYMTKQQFFSIHNLVNMILKLQAHGHFFGLKSNSHTTYKKMVMHQYSARKRMKVGIEIYIRITRLRSEHQQQRWAMYNLICSVICRY